MLDQSIPQHQRHNPCQHFEDEQQRADAEVSVTTCPQECDNFATRAAEAPIAVPG